ncbi:hypothetical protein [Terrabacter sp. 2RAF25]|uniref:hypothetical protein n=1 Tax=Terrabacter sp. 2RAF25 TaxID=3232998 RepID=UPI003F9E8C55
MASSPAPAPVAATVAPPAAAPGEAVITKAAGQGSSRGADVTTDGSYTAYLVCHGGTEVTVVSTATESRTAIPCTGYVSRMRFLTEKHGDSLTVRADAGQEWALTVADSTVAG